MVPIRTRTAVGVHVVPACFVAAHSRGMAKSRRRNKPDAGQQVCRNPGDNVAWLGLRKLENVFVAQHRL